jgi:hypothetical protein
MARPYMLREYQALIMIEADDAGEVPHTTED